MKKLLLIVITLLSVTVCRSQKSKLIYGTWTLTRVETDSLVFDLQDTATTYSNYYNYQKRITKKIFTMEDSLLVKNHFSNLMADYRKYFFSFNKDGSYQTNKFRGGSKITNDTISENFRLKNKKYIIVSKDNKEKFRLKILVLTEQELIIRMTSLNPVNDFTFNLCYQKQ